MPPGCARPAPGGNDRHTARITQRPPRSAYAANVTSLPGSFQGVCMRRCEKTSVRAKHGCGAVATVGPRFQPCAQMGQRTNLLGKQNQSDERFQRCGHGNDKPPLGSRTRPVNGHVQRKAVKRCLVHHIIGLPWWDTDKTRRPPWSAATKRFQGAPVGSGWHTNRARSWCGLRAPRSLTRVSVSFRATSAHARADVALAPRPCALSGRVAPLPDGRVGRLVPRTSFPSAGALKARH